MTETKSGIGLKKETAAALSALLGPTIIIPAIIFILERDKFVRFYAIQSVLSFLTLFVLWQIFLMSVILIPFGGLLWITGFILWLLLTYKAWEGKRWEIPLIAKLSEKIVGNVV